MAVTTSSAAELLSAQVQSLLVEPLEKQSVFLAAGPRIFDTDGNAVKIPKLNSMGTPVFTSEGSAISEADPDIGEITLLPSTMKSVKVITRVSNELLRQSVVQLNTALQDRLVRDVAAVLDTAFIDGTATNEPTGILHYSGATIAGTAAGTVTLDALYDTVQAALGANVQLDACRWLMTGRDYIKLHKQKTTDGAYYLNPTGRTAGAAELLGIPVTVTDRIPGGTSGGTTTIVLADFSQIAVARDLAPSVTILPERYADYDQTAIRVVARYDAAPMNAAAVTLLKGVTFP